jgi:CheY-like chemotaxis protein
MPENLTVLVVDDDGEVLDVAAAVLAGEGYAVLRAESPTQALAVLGSKERVDLLFTDIVMPGEMDGFELAHRARQMRPELRILYTSGHFRRLARVIAASATAHCWRSLGAPPRWPIRCARPSTPDRLSPPRQTALLSRAVK